MAEINAKYKSVNNGDDDDDDDDMPPPQPPDDRHSRRFAHVCVTCLSFVTINVSCPLVSIALSQFCDVRVGAHLRLRP